MAGEGGGESCSFFYTGVDYIRLRQNWANDYYFSKEILLFPLLCPIVFCYAFCYAPFVMRKAYTWRSADSTQGARVITAHLLVTSIYKANHIITIILQKP